MEQPKPPEIISLLQEAERFHRSIADGFSYEGMNGFEDFAKDMTDLMRWKHTTIANAIRMAIAMLKMSYTAPQGGE